MYNCDPQTNNQYSLFHFHKNVTNQSEVNRRLLHSTTQKYSFLLEHHKTLSLLHHLHYLQLNLICIMCYCLHKIFLHKIKRQFHYLLLRKMQNHQNHLHHLNHKNNLHALYCLLNLPEE